MLTPDEKVLPHCAPGDVNLLFPRAQAREDFSEVHEPVDELERRGEQLGRQTNSKRNRGLCLGYFFLVV